MSIKVSCPQCSHVATYKDNSAGKSAKCRKCGKSFPIPNSTGDGVATDEEDWDLLASLEQQAKPTRRKKHQAKTDLEAQETPGFFISAIGKVGEVILGVFSPRITIGCLACLGVGFLIWQISTGAISFDAEAASAKRAQEDARSIARQFKSLKPGMAQADAESSLGTNSLRELKCEEMIERLCSARSLSHFGAPIAFKQNQAPPDNNPQAAKKLDYDLLRYDDGQNQLLLRDPFFVLLGRNPNQRFYEILTALEISPPVPIRGEPIGDFWDREKLYKRRLGKVGASHYFIILQYSEKMELQAAFALSLADSVGVGPLQEKPWWNKSFLGSELLREEGIQ